MHSDVDSKKVDELDKLTLKTTARCLAVRLIPVKRSYFPRGSTEPCGDSTPLYTVRYENCSLARFGRVPTVGGDLFSGPTSD